MRDVKEPEIRRAEIMDAAMILFMEKGYTNTTTQDIVDKVNISRGLLYYHFKNKEDILYCLIEQYSDRLLKDIYIIAYDEDKTAIEKIRSFIDVTIISSENISAEGIRYHIRNLKKSGKIRREGSTKSGKWIVKGRENE